MSRAQSIAVDCNRLQSVFGSGWKAWGGAVVALATAVLAVTPPPVTCCRMTVVLPVTGAALPPPKTLPSTATVAVVSTDPLREEATEDMVVW